jgi:amidase
MALGSDQGGSIRIPASYCGVHGLKPTFGLVPYSGIATLEASIDHCGPITATTADNALLLEVIAGPDGLDDRQRQIPVSSYSRALAEGVHGLRIGILKEGFAATNSDPRVDAKVLAAARLFAALGASVEEVSIPWHLNGTAVWSPITYEGGFISMWASHGLGIGVPSLGVPSVATACAAWRDRPDEQADTVRMMMLFGRAALDRYRGAYYAKANNLRRILRAAYDAALVRLDLLLMPTMPTTAPPLPDAGADLQTRTGASWPMAANLCPFNVTGHPALSAPCGMIDGLPVGMMLVAGHGGEASIYRAAGAFEASHDWKSL